MIEQLSQMQARTHTMREALLKEGSVVPEEECIVTSLEAKKEVLWYLDLIAAAVAGAHRHMSNMEHDDIFSATEKEGKQKQIIELLRQDLGWLPATIKDLFYCLDEHFEEYEADKRQPPPNVLAREEVAENRQRVSEILDQLELLDQEVRNMFRALNANVT